jgi:hypothetical protein
MPASMPRSMYSVFPTLEARIKTIRQSAYNELVVEATGCDECQGEDAPMEHEASSDTEGANPDECADARSCDGDAEGVPARGP